MKSNSHNMAQIPDTDQQTMMTTLKSFISWPVCLLVAGEQVPLHQRRFCPLPHRSARWRQSAHAPTYSNHQCNPTLTSHWTLLWQPLYSWVSCSHCTGMPVIPTSQVSGEQTGKAGSKICCGGKTARSNEHSLIVSLIVRLVSKSSQMTADF